MMTEHYTLRIQKTETIVINGERTRTPNIDVVDKGNLGIHRFDYMCSAIGCDIQHPQGSGAQALEEIRKIESGEAQKIEADGNAWVAHITKERVWFEGLYNQGEGGEVSLAQYKLAVQTYVQFLSDPEQKCIEVAFPAE
jgi:hypothetical protein